MISTSHIIIGAAVGASTGNIPLAFFSGIASHFLSDAVPHTDPGTFMRSEGEKVSEELHFPLGVYIFAFGDIFVGLLFLGYILLQTESSLLFPILAGVGGSMLPDMIDNVPFWSPYLRKFQPFKFLHIFHDEIAGDLSPKNWVWGVITQLIITGGTLWLLLA